MEACGSAHYFARLAQEYGHQAKLIDARRVKAFRDGNKNDKKDAEAIMLASLHPKARFVQGKSIAQQEIQSLHRIRERRMKQRIETSNQLRGLLMEFGYVMPKGLQGIVKNLPDILEQARAKLSGQFIAAIEEMYREIQRLENLIQQDKKNLEKIAKESAEASSIRAIPGIGPIIATAILALGDLKHFKNGRNFAAFLGLVPREDSSGGEKKIQRHQ